MLLAEELNENSIKTQVCINSEWKVALNGYASPLLAVERRKSVSQKSIIIGDPVIYMIENMSVNEELCYDTSKYWILFGDYVCVY